MTSIIIVQPDAPLIAKGSDGQCVFPDGVTVVYALGGELPRESIARQFYESGAPVGAGIYSFKRIGTVKERK